MIRAMLCQAWMAELRGAGRNSPRLENSQSKTLQNRRIPTLPLGPRPPRHLEGAGPGPCPCWSNLRVQALRGHVHVLLWAGSPAAATFCNSLKWFWPSFRQRRPMAVRSALSSCLSACSRFTDERREALTDPGPLHSSNARMDALHGGRQRAGSADQSWNTELHALLPSWDIPPTARKGFWEASFPPPPLWFIKVRLFQITLCCWLKLVFKVIKYSVKMWGWHLCRAICLSVK